MGCISIKPLKIIILLLLAFYMFGCKENEHIDFEEEIVDVNLKYSFDEGFIPSSGQDSRFYTPKSSNDDLYAVQVRSAIKENNPEVAYSCGLFDDLTKLKLSLVKDRYYNIVITCIKSAKQILICNNGAYGKPFDLTLGEGATVTNELKRGSITFNSLSTGLSELTYGTYEHPDYDRYYGESGRFYLSSEHEINIELKRVVFSLDVEANDSYKTKVVLEGAPEIILMPKEKRSVLVCFKGGKSGSWTSETYNEKIGLNMKIEEDGLFKPYGNPMEIDFKRRYTYPVKALEFEDGFVGGGAEIGKGDVSVDFENPEFIQSDSIIFNR